MHCYLENWYKHISSTWIIPKWKLFVENKFLFSYLEYLLQGLDSVTQCHLRCCTASISTGQADAIRGLQETFVLKHNRMPWRIPSGTVYACVGKSVEPRAFLSISNSQTSKHIQSDVSVPTYPVPTKLSRRKQKWAKLVTKKKDHHCRFLQ